MARASTDGSRRRATVLSRQPCASARVTTLTGVQPLLSPLPETVPCGRVIGCGTCSIAPATSVWPGPGVLPTATVNPPTCSPCGLSVRRVTTRVDLAVVTATVPPSDLTTVKPPGWASVTVPTATFGLGPEGGGGSNGFTLSMAPTLTDVAASVPLDSVPLTATWAPLVISWSVPLASEPIILVDGAVVIVTDRPSDARRTRAAPSTRSSRPVTAARLGHPSTAMRPARAVVVPPGAGRASPPPRAAVRPYRAPAITSTAAAAAPTRRRRTCRRTRAASVRETDGT